MCDRHRRRSGPLLQSLPRESVPQRDQRRCHFGRWSTEPMPSSRRRRRSRALTSDGTALYLAGSCLTSASATGDVVPLEQHPGDAVSAAAVSPSASGVASPTTTTLNDPDRDHVVGRLVDRADEPRPLNAYQDRLDRDLDAPARRPAHSPLTNYDRLPAQPTGSGYGGSGTSLPMISQVHPAQQRSERYMSCQFTHGVRQRGADPSATRTTGPARDRRNSPPSADAGKPGRWTLGDGPADSRTLGRGTCGQATRAYERRNVSRPGASGPRLQVPWPPGGRDLGLAQRASGSTGGDIGADW